MNAIDPQRLRAAMDAVDPVDADAAFAARAATEGSRRTRRNRAMGVVGGLSALVVVGALTAPLWLSNRDAVPSIATPSPVPSVTSWPSEVPTPSSTPSASAAPSASPSATPSPTASGTAPVAADRLITPQGVGVLRVGMTMEEGIQLGVSTDQGEYCGPWDMSEEGFRRYPGVWAYWSGQLNSLAITPKSGQDESVIPGLEYATAEGIRVQDTFADVRAAYGERAVEWTSDAEHWAGIDDVSLPNVPPREGEPLVRQLDGLLVRDGDRALVFLGNDGVIEYIVATSIDDEGKAQVVHGC